MYLRRSIVRKGGKTHTYWRLVRSVRRGKKVRQETVATLGELDSEGRSTASALAKHFLRPRAQQRELCEETPSGEIGKVLVDQVRVERRRGVGDVWLGHKLWQSLELDHFLEKVKPPRRERVPWIEVMEILVLARLCEPSSELHIAEDWYQKTALEDLLGVAPDLIHHTRLYRGMDRLLEHKDALQKHIKDRFGTLFDLDYDLMLYDVTSTYFEGLAEGNELAARGHSRDSRSDCKQVCIGLVVTRDGFPVAYEVFAGNRTDVTTVEEIVEAMEKRHGKASRVWVMDRGMTSERNLQWLREGGRSYLVGTPKSELKRFERELIEDDGWKKVRAGLEVKLCEGCNGTETFILCRSEDRQKKEAAMHGRFSERIEKGLSQLGRRIERSKQPLDKLEIGQQIGRLFAKNSRAAAKFKVEVVDDKTMPAGFRLHMTKNQKWSDWAALTEGAYILRSNVANWSPEELWRTYIQLTHAEAAFRIQKSDLSIRPIWHH